VNKCKNNSLRVICYVRFEFLKALTVKNISVLNVTPWSLVKLYIWNKWEAMSSNLT
jgi:hypothetical protein